MSENARCQNGHARVETRVLETLACPGLLSALVDIDERQITHLICARLKYDLSDFFRGCYGLASFLFLV